MIQELFKPFAHLQSIKQMMLMVGIYLIFALPFSVMEFIPEFTNLRPVTALIPLYGIFFGPTGAWGCAIGNLLYDILSGTLVISSIGGFIGNFTAVALFWAFSKHFMRDKHLLGSMKTFFVYAIVSVISALAVSSLVVFWVACFIPHVDAAAVAISIFGNDLFFFLVPGAGVAIIMSTEFGFSLAPHRT